VRRVDAQPEPADGAVRRRLRCVLDEELGAESTAAARILPRRHRRPSARAAAAAAATAATGIIAAVGRREVDDRTLKA
jgi:hypothetical protein